VRAGLAISTRSSTLKGLSRGAPSGARRHGTGMVCRRRAGYAPADTWQRLATGARAGDRGTNCQARQRRVRSSSPPARGAAVGPQCSTAPDGPPYEVKGFATAEGGGCGRDTGVSPVRGAARRALDPHTRWPAGGNRRLLRRWDQAKDSDEVTCDALGRAMASASPHRRKDCWSGSRAKPHATLRVISASEPCAQGTLYPSLRR